MNDLGRNIDAYFASLQSVDSRQASDAEAAQAEEVVASGDGGWQTVTAQGSRETTVERVAVPIGESTTADGKATVDVVLVDPSTGKSDGKVRTVEVDKSGEPSDGDAVEVDGFKTVYAKPNK